MTALLFCIIGLVLGSFSNVLIARLPQKKSVGGHSECPHCHKTLRPIELIPILSFVLLFGQCRSCRERISMRYPLVEGASGALAVLALVLAPSLPEAVILGLALWLLLTISIIDWKTHGIPDVLSFPFIALGFLYSFLTGVFDWRGILVGTGFFAAQWLISRGKWIGSGDILLALGASALLGSWKMNLMMLFFAYVMGAVIASFLLVTKRLSRKDAIAFGPFIALGTMVTLIFGEVVLNAVFWI